MLKPNTKDAYNLLHAGTLAFARAEQAGMRIDIDYCTRKKAFLTKKVEHLRSQLNETDLFKHWKHYFGSKFNINSNWQLAQLLYNVKKITPLRFTATGKGATDDEALSELHLPELDKWLEIKKLLKIRDTYLDAFLREQVDGIMHPFFNLHTVKTYRSSSDKPNFQNIPKRDEESMKLCRRAIYPRHGHQLVEFDYSGMEVRISVCYHKDPTMLKYINDPKSDMHRDMAIQLFLLKNFDKKIPLHGKLRYFAKSDFVFPQFYGDYYINCAANMCKDVGLTQTDWKLGRGLPLMDELSGRMSDHFIAQGIKSFEQFTEHVKKIEKHFWSVRFPVYAKWKEKWWEDYQNKGYLDMLTGFRCSGLMRKNDAVNYPIQGSAFHCLLWAFIEIDKIARKEKWQSRLIGQIHDAIVADVHPDELDHVVSTIKYISCEAIRKAWPWITVPLDIETEVCDVDTSWADKKLYKV